MTEQTTKTKSQEIATDVSALLRARNPLLWIVTVEEKRVERYLFEAAAAAGFITRTWDVGQGVCEIDGKIVGNMGGPDISATLSAISARSTADTTDRCVWVLRDLHLWLRDPVALRQVRNLARSLSTVKRNNAQAMIVISPSGDIPPELAGHTTVIEWPIPDRDEIAAMLDAAVSALPEKDQDGNQLRSVAAPNGTRDAAIDAAVGLTGEEAQACFARSLVQSRKIEPLLIANEKKRIVAREGVLEWYDPLPGGMSAVGGLDVLKAWLMGRTAAYSPKARAYGLPAPKGALIAGIPGTGKSLTAKATATAFGVPLLRMDMGALKGKFVGESEAKLRKAFQVVEAIGRSVLWIDELEKALAGATQGAADGGVSADALGFVLNWMQERKSETFVIATANDVEALPPELLRKGRFDEVFFVDLPTRSERASILEASLRSYGRDFATLQIDTIEIAKATANFTGSEIAALVPEAMFVAFGDSGREITTADLISVARTCVPMAKTAPEKIEKLRKWGNERARRASRPEVGESLERSDVRVLDLT